MKHDGHGARPVMSTTRVVVLGFAFVILLGALLLTLPISSSTGVSVGFFDALFTSTSCVCVTGLVVVDTGTAFSTFGHVVIILLIQIGGLGFMSVAMLYFMLLGKRVTLGTRLVIQESLNEDRIGGLVRMMRWVIFSALSIEGIGALILSTRFIPIYGFGKGLWYGVFHSISAFCNAGFDLIGNYQNLMPFQYDPVVNITICLLIIIGGLGFAVLQDIKHNRSFRKLRLHSKLVITFTAILLFGGTLIVLLVEWSNPATLGPMNFFQKLQAAFFQSVTLRTAGFNTIDQASLLPATKMISVILMFIGASPASTGGGVKTSTMAVLCLNVRMVARGRSEIAAYHRTINRDTMQRALAIVMIGLAVLLIDIMALTLLEPQANFLDLAFECASALGTVGVSSVGTGTLEPVSRMLLILAMYIGRVGPLTLTMALGHKQAQTKDAFRYPEERVLVG
ncbi:MAG TPA: Trk family potassium uptake protein [Candidatus Pullichristensenella stercorigallinarum]|uniref:Trk family potassium uptake protein n=1 Tax=Candidatus Pullichristensenella stercorigallinarum TaxID=2840909 RepID=A0A9D0ZLR3_9FIRM|nr:Trk family potassium uptake protein [Candidatus Pullichristensenella stercorigallinarum]